MKKLIICGNGNISRNLSCYLQKNFEILAYTIPNKFIKKSNYKNKPVIPIEKIDKFYSPKEVVCITAIGYLEMNKVREDLTNFLKKKKFKFTNYIDDKAFLSSDLIIGKNNFILDNVSVSNNCKIGHGNIFWSNSTLSHNSKIKNYNWISSGSIISGHVNIGNKNFFGSNSTISDKSLLGNSVFVGANTLITGKISNNTTFIANKTQKLNIKSLNYLKYLKYEK